MEIGRDWDQSWKNQWPQETDAPRFKQTMLEFYSTCHELHVHVMRAIALGLELEEDYFDRKIDQQCHNLRLLSYPPIRTSLLPLRSNRFRVTDLLGRWGNDSVKCRPEHVIAPARKQVSSIDHN